MTVPVAALMLWLSGPLAVEAGSPVADPESPVAAARDALPAQPDMPWYDPARDTLRRISVQPPEDDAYRQSRWAAEVTGAAPADDPPQSLLSRIMQLLAWLALAVALAAVMWLLVWAAGHLDRRRVTGGPSVERMPVGPERLEDLPMTLPPTDRDLLAAARACYQAGDFGMAIVYAYAYQLMELDHHRAIQLRKGKTNRQYLRELRTQPRLRELLHDTMIAFEDVFFGNHTLSRPQFQRCWDNLDEFHRQLERLG